MIRLTVLYNLPEGADEAEFLRWRLGEHQQNNASRPGVLRTDFAVVESAWPRGAAPRHRFMTIAEYPDRETFEKSFYEPEAQARFQENLKKLDDPVFLMGEVLISNVG